MIAGIFHAGSGCGNQLHRYIATRCLALKKGYEWGMLFKENFKGTFIECDLGKPVEGTLHSWYERKVVNERNCDVRPYDPTVLNVKDDTVIDGEFQDYQYFAEYLDEVREWLKVEPMNLPHDLCVINFRGGEYVGVPDLFLPKEYWEKAMAMMQKKYPIIRFEVHTDDAETAKQFFPDLPIVSNMSINWRAIRYAKHLILSNSSFAILPALLGEAREIYAPLYWAGHNKGFWQLPQNIYKRFTYI